MMDTILNLGLNDVAVEGFAQKTGNPALSRTIPTAALSRCSRTS